MTKWRLEPIDCTRCCGRLEVTRWRPPRGIDPELREFECYLCGLVTYVRIPGEVTPAAKGPAAP